MCDIYLAVCSLCKKNKVNMHLGDFATDRDEIAIVCHECLTEEYRKLRKIIPHAGDEILKYAVCALAKKFKNVRGVTVWLYADFTEDRMDGKFVAIYSLTENAWKHRDINHPNKYVLIKEFELDPKEIEETWKMLQTYMKTLGTTSS